MNPEHEVAIKKMINEMYPEMFVSISSELAPVIKEYERTATTCINAYLGKVTSNYLSSLDEKLKGSGLKHPTMIMQAMGGFVSSHEACEKPIVTLASGPVGGVIGARVLAGLMGYQNVITTDVGGTSFDVGLVVQGETEFAVAPVFSKYHISIPMVDIISIGAGGGSIAWIEPGTGLLKVGPQSAGADPGPACYGLGGVEPTVTDADLILNRYDPNYFLGGRMRIDRDKALSAMRQRIAEPLKMDVAEAAMGVVDIVNSQMADLLRKVTIGRGYDPRDFVVFAFGGAGPAHAGAYGLDVGVKHAVVPFFASVFSAFGITTSDIVHIKEMSVPETVPVDVKRVNANYERLIGDVMEEFRRDEIQEESILLTRSMDLRYKGQVHEVRAAVPSKDLTEEDMEKVVDEFERAYEDKYGKGTAYRAAGIEAVTYRVSGIGKILKPTISKHELGSADSSSALKGTREVFFKEYGGFKGTKVYGREMLRAGNALEGPAIIEAFDTTVVIHPDQTARVDEYLNIIIELS
jgi:N-methylhydantoinase A